MSWRSFVLAFVPLFFAVDAFGVLPIFASLTEDFSPKQRLLTVRDSLITALLVAFAFLFVGKAVFRLIGVGVSDFLVAGGLLLLVISLSDVIAAEKGRHRPLAGVGAVPLGTPLIVGPGALTTIMLSLDGYGLWPTFVSVIANVAVAGAVFASGEFLMRALGQNGARAISKVASLLLAAIAVMMIRRGLVAFLPD